MKGRREWCIRFWLKIILYHFSIMAILFTHCDARKAKLLSKDVSYPRYPTNIKHLKILDVAKNLNMVMDISVKDSSNLQPYVSSPFNMPPFDSLAPIPLPDSNNDNPPYCIYPPPQSPSAMPNPVGYSPTPPSSSTSSPNIPLLSPPQGPTDTFPSPPDLTPGPPESFPSPPDLTPGPPESFPSPPDLTPGSPESFPSPPDITPGPPESFPSPSISVPNPPFYEPSPPSRSTFPSPPENVPSPIGFEPSPPVFLPPVVYPPPTTRKPPSTSGQHVWCVAKPSVPDPILQEAMNYACGSGADCSPIQPNGSCYQPDTPLAHTSYAFNSYWQRTKVAGGTCEFGGTAMLVTVDPSSSGCKFEAI